MKNKKIIFASTTKNPNIYNLESQINNYIKVGRKFSEFKIILIESNSDSDKNINYLKKKYFKENNIVIKNLGVTDEKVKFSNLRTEHIAYARNQYLSYQYLNNKKVIKGIGDLRKFNTKLLMDIINGISKNDMALQNEKKTSIIDGNQKKRILNLLQKL